MTRRPPRSTLLPYTTLSRSNSAGSSQAASAPTGVVPQQPQAPLNTQPPQISGTVAVGQQLQASPGSWRSAPHTTEAQPQPDLVCRLLHDHTNQATTASSHTI